MSKPRTWAALNAITGGLSAPSKMPCHGWSIPAEQCAMGSLLRKVKGSTCSDCYALKGNYIRYPAVIPAMKRRLQAWKDDRVAWVDAMAESINKTKNPHFRWFDSGDLQGREMLEDIIRVAELTPEVSHWLPTREKDIVIEYFGLEEWTRDVQARSNLVIRMSAPMKDTPLNAFYTRGPGGLPTSSVYTGEAPEWISEDDPYRKVCPAPTQDGKCEDCRTCWNPNIKEVAYAAH